MFIDWSQNSASKTTLAPYYVAGPGTAVGGGARDRPGVRSGPAAVAVPRGSGAGRRRQGICWRGWTIPLSSHENVADLSEYRSKRDGTKTPEPFGDDNHRRTRAGTDFS